MIPLDTLVVPLVVISMDENMIEDYSVSIDDILDFEEKYGRIQKNCFIMVHTGWSKYWDQPKKYHNNYLFPSVSKEVANLLISRKIVGLGIDTLSPDLPSSGFPVHDIILKNQKYIVENVANIEKCPKQGLMF